MRLWAFAGAILAFSLLAPLANSQVITLQRDQSWNGITDTFIGNSGGNLSYSGSGLDYLQLHCNSGSSRWCSYRSLVKFDLSSLQGQQVMGAFLSLYDYQHAYFPFTNESISVHELSSDWTTNATILTRDGSSAWVARGGDFSQTPLDSLKVGSAGEWKSWDVTSSVNRFLSGSPNYGWILRGEHDSIYGSGWDIDARFRSSRYSDQAFTPKLTIVVGSSQSELQSVKDQLGITARQSLLDQRQLLELKAIQIAESQSVAEQPNATFSIQPGTWVFQPNWYSANAVMDLNLSQPFEQQLLQKINSDALMVNSQSVELSLSSAPVFSHRVYASSLGGWSPTVNSANPTYYLIEKLSDTHYRFYLDDGFLYEGAPPTSGTLEQKFPYYNDASFEFYLKPSAPSPDEDGLCTPSENSTTSPIDCFYLKMAIRSHMPELSEGIRAEFSALAPRWNNIPAQAVTVGSPFPQLDLWLYALAPNATPASLTYSVANQSNTTLTDCNVSGNRYLSCSTPSGVGSSVVTVQATNHVGSGQASISMQSNALPNNAPVWASIPDQNVIAGNPVSDIDLWNYVSDDHDSQSSLTYSIVSQSNPSVTNCTIGSLIHYVGCPAPVSVGTNTVTVRATDTAGAYSDTNFSITANPAPNSAPYWSAIPNQTITLGNSFAQIDLWSYAHDSNDAASSMAYGIVSQSNSSLSNCSVSSNRYVDCPTPSATGTNNVVVRVTDTGSLSADTNFLLTVNPAPNTAPEARDVSVSPNTTYDSNNLACNYAYFDAENDPESGTAFAWFENGSPISGQSSQTLNNSFTIVGSQYYCKVKPQAATGTNGSQWYQSSNTVTVQADPVHDLNVSQLSFSTSPLWTNYSNAVSVLVSNKGNQGETVTLRFSVDSAEQGTQTFSLSAGASETRTFYWSPTAVGTYNLQVSADYVAGETSTGDNSVSQSMDVLDSNTINNNYMAVWIERPATAPEQTSFDVNGVIANQTNKPFYNMPITISVMPEYSLNINESPTKIIPVIPANSTVKATWNVSSTDQNGNQRLKVASINAQHIQTVIVYSYSNIIMPWVSNGGNLPKDTFFDVNGFVGNNSDVPLHNVQITLTVMGDLTFADASYTKTIADVPPHSNGYVVWRLKTNNSTGFQKYYVTALGVQSPKGNVYVLS